MSLAALKRKTKTTQNISGKNPNGFSINNIRKTRGILPILINSYQNSDIGCNNITHCCCNEDNNTSIKKSTKSTNGHLTIKYQGLTNNTKNYIQKNKFVNYSQSNNIINKKNQY